MALSDYTGESPRDADEGRVVGRVSRHSRWNVDEETRGRCANCEDELALGERHLLVTLRVRHESASDRRHLCDERCLDEWMSGDGENV